MNYLKFQLNDCSSFKRKLKGKDLKIIYLILFPILSAFLLTLSSPGYDIWFLSFISFIPILVSLEDRNYFFLKISLFSISYYFYNLLWLNSSVSHFGNAPLVVGLMVVLGMAIYMTFYLLLFFYSYVKTKNTLIQGLIFVIIEIIRGKIFTGFPWLNLGLNLYSADFFTNFYSIFGEYGVSFFIIIVNLAIFQIVIKKNYKNFYILCSLPILLIIINVLEKDHFKDQNINISIVQHGLRQEEKWLPEKREEIVEDILNLTFDAVTKESNLIVLPESLFPFFVQNDNVTFDTLKFLSEYKDILIGNIRYDEELNFYNSAFFFSNREVSFYDKIHLVPFGEYFPLKILTAPISRYFFGDAKDFTKGEKYKIFYTRDGIKLLPLICYESSFYSLIRKGVNKYDPDILVVISNDSWFGNTIGRMQHLAIDIVRAKEFHKPLIRATQSGISACIDEKGKILKKLGNDEKGIMNCNIKLTYKKSLFSKYGYLWFALFSAVVVAFTRRKHR